MAVKVKLVRNPYPLPDVSREGIWIPDKPYLGQNVSINDRRWYARLQPHERLFAHHTLNSVRKDCRLHSPKVPTDSLDYALSSMYEHCKDTFVPKTYTRIQPETLGKETWRVLRNQIKTFKSLPPRLGHPLRIAITQEEPTINDARPATSHTREESKRHSERRSFSATERKTSKIRRIHPSSVKLAIDGPHMDQTNAGYSRKVDGTFYSI